MTKQDELQDLKKQLGEMERMHRDVWSQYGSELSSGDMSRKEDELIRKIIALEAEMKEDIAGPSSNAKTPVLHAGDEG